MNLDGKIVIVTGAGSGIGRALADRFAAERARRVIAVDRNGAAAHETAALAPAVIDAAEIDVTDDAQIAKLVADVEATYGSIDLFASNAGVGIDGGPDADDDAWDTSWRVNVMAHVFAARHALPGMLANGRGYFLQTASAAGLLTQLGSAPYAVTKHAAVSFAEWLSITYGDRGIGVSVLCPQAVRTPMLEAAEAGAADAAGVDGVLEPSDVAEAAVRGLEREEFLILPHPIVQTYMARKAADLPRWLSGMRKLQARVAGSAR